MTCRRGHEFRGDENYRARKGWCPVCFKAAQQKYEQTDKAKDRTRVYNQSEKGQARKARYLDSPKGWKQALTSRRRHALRRRAERDPE